MLKRYDPAQAAIVPASAPDVPRVVQTPFIEHPYDAHRRRERDRTIRLGKHAPHGPAPPTAPPFVDSFGLKARRLTLFRRF